MMVEKVNFDNDQRYRRPAAWRKAKEALGSNPLSKAEFRIFEGLAGSSIGDSPRDLIFAAMHHFACMTAEERQAALVARHQAVRARQLLDREFFAIMEKIFESDEQEGGTNVTA